MIINQKRDIQFNQLKKIFVTQEVLRYYKETKRYYTELEDDAPEGYTPRKVVRSNTHKSVIDKKEFEELSAYLKKYGQKMLLEGYNDQDAIINVYENLDNIRIPIRDFISDSYIKKKKRIPQKYMKILKTFEKNARNDLIELEKNKNKLSLNEYNSIKNSLMIDINKVKLYYTHNENEDVNKEHRKQQRILRNAKKEYKELQLNKWKYSDIYYKQLLSTILEKYNLSELDLK